MKNQSKRHQLVQIWHTLKNVFGFCVEFDSKASTGGQVCLAIHDFHNRNSQNNSTKAAKFGRLLLSPSCRWPQALFQIANNRILH